MHAITVAHITCIGISIIQQTQDTTPLHKAAAYGHLETVKLKVHLLKWKTRLVVTHAVSMHACINYINTHVYIVSFIGCYKEVYDWLMSDPGPMVDVPLYQISPEMFSALWLYNCQMKHHTLHAGRVDSSWCCKEKASSRCDEIPWRKWYRCIAKHWKHCNMKYIIMLCITLSVLFVWKIDSISLSFSTDDGKLISLLTKTVSIFDVDFWIAHCHVYFCRTWCSESRGGKERTGRKKIIEAEKEHAISVMKKQIAELNDELKEKREKFSSLSYELERKDRELKTLREKGLKSIYWWIPC